MEKVQKPCWKFTGGIIIYLLLAFLLSLATRMAASREAGGLDPSCAKLLQKCKKIKLPDGTTVETVPKLARTALEDACLVRRSKYGIPPKQIVCRFPDCYSNPCQNGWCNETLKGYQCYCSTGFQGKHCTEKISATVFVTDHGANAIFVADLRDELNFTLISTLKPRFIAYDTREGKIYWSDCEKVCRSDLTGANRENVTAVNVPYGIAIAERSRTLYVAYSDVGKIVSVSIKHGSALPGMETDFVNQSIPNPRALAVDENEGYLYISVKQGIVRALLNATNDIEKVYQHTALRDITGLSIDLSGNPRRIFFCDMVKKRTFYMEVKTPRHTSREVELTEYLHDPYDEELTGELTGLSYFNGVLYWVKQNSPKGIGIMTNYDKPNRLYKVQQVNQFIKPMRILISFIDP